METKSTKVKAIIEKCKDGGYSVYPDWGKIKSTYSIIGDGNTKEEAVADFQTAYNEMKAYYAEIGEKFQEVEFVFYDDSKIINDVKREDKRVFA
jgi:predicted RNase H-like HicB family nuclease